jgi:hypothetical protein
LRLPSSKCCTSESGTLPTACRDVASGPRSSSGLPSVEVPVITTLNPRARPLSARLVNRPVACWSASVSVPGAACRSWVAWSFSLFTSTRTAWTRWSTSPCST